MAVYGVIDRLTGFRIGGVYESEAAAWRVVDETIANSYDRHDANVDRAGYLEPIEVLS